MHRQAQFSSGLGHRARLFGRFACWPLPKVSVRFHDLRHTCVTRMLEGGAPLSVVAAILGWSAATTVRMAKRYGHIGQVAQRQAVERLDAKPKKTAEEKSRADRPGQSLSH